MGLVGAERLGPLNYNDEQSPGFMGMPGAPGSQFSPEINLMIDEEVRAIVNENYQRAEMILLMHMEILDNMAEALMAWETIDKFQIDRLMQGEKLPAPEFKHTELASVENNQTSTDNNKKEGNAAIGLEGLAT